MEIEAKESKKLIELNRINEKAFAEKYIGEVIDVLFEEEVELGSEDLHWIYKKLYKGKC